MLDILDGLQTIEMGLEQGLEYKYLNANRIQGRTACAPDLLGYSRPKQTNTIEGFDATLDAKEESSGLFATSNQMHFYVWLSFMILLLWYLVRVVFKNKTTIYDADSLTLFNWQNAIILVSCIWTLSTVWEWRPAWMREEWYTIPAWLR